VVCYHWKMKFIEAQVAEARERVSEGGAAVWADVQEHVKAAQEQWAALRPRLDQYAHRWCPRLFLTRSEAGGTEGRECGREGGPASFKRVFNRAA